MREWSFRLLSELPYHDSGIFLTLTYDEEKNPIELNHKHVQLFLKRLRKNISARSAEKKIKYYCVGEYGTTTCRPHYHLIIFGYWPPDGRKNQFTDYWESPTLDKLWDMGHTSYGEITPASTRYCAGYIQKKLKYEGDYGDITPPYSAMSNGIGLRYLQTNSERLKRDLYIQIDGYPAALPRYYKKKLEIPTEVLQEKYKAELEHINDLYRQNGISDSMEIYKSQKAIRIQKNKELKWKKEFLTNVLNEL